MVKMALQPFLSIIQSFLALLSASGTLIILSYLWTTERKAPHILQSSFENSKSNQPSKPVSVIVTARNEERVIGRCISALENQSYPNLEIIVVDDNSTDNTHKIAYEFQRRDTRVSVFDAGAKPKDWVGKSWACHRGFMASKGEVLLFVDADSSFDSRTLTSSMDRFQSESIDMYSLSPTVSLHGVWSHSVMPLISGAINLLYPMKKVNDRKNKRAYVFGTFVLVKRSCYVAIGGHEAVRNRLVEDAAIAQAAKSKGFKLRVENGDGLITTDWESDLSDVFHGLERVFSESVRSNGQISILNAVVLFFLGLYPIAFILGYFTAYFLGGNDLITLSSNILSLGLSASILSVLLALLIAANELRSVSGKVRLYPLLYPIGFALFICAIITSSRKVSSAGGFVWKGERYEQKLVPR